MRVEIWKLEGWTLSEVPETVRHPSLLLSRAQPHSHSIASARPVQYVNPSDRLASELIVYIKLCVHQIRRIPNKSAIDRKYSSAKFTF